MSAIFDLLRQRPREETNESATNSPYDNTTGQVLQSSSETRQQVLKGLESVRCDVRPEYRLVGCGQNYNLGAEKFRLLGHRLRQLRRRQSLSRVLVTSAIPKEGKTLVAINLALGLARSSPQVALVDADMRQPGVHRALGLESLPGLAEFLEGNLEPAACIRRVDPLGLYYLPAGHASVNPFELLQRPRMRELMELIAPAFDWIIFDSPPLIPFADAHCLSTLVDAALLVVRPGVTPRKTLQQGLDGLCGTYLAGVVFNASNDARQDQYYYDYYDTASARLPADASHAD